jgi:hypothetical protein
MVLFDSSRLRDGPPAVRIFFKLSLIIIFNHYVLGHLTSKSLEFAKLFGRQKSVIPLFLLVDTS